MVPLSHLEKSFVKAPGFKFSLCNLLAVQSTLQVLRSGELSWVEPVGQCLEHGRCLISVRIIPPFTLEYLYGYSALKQFSRKCLTGEEKRLPSDPTRCPGLSPPSLRCQTQKKSPQLILKLKMIEIVFVYLLQPGRCAEKAT